MKSTQPSIMLIPCFFANPNTADSWILVDAMGNAMSEADMFTYCATDGAFLTLSTGAVFVDDNHSQTSIATVSYGYMGSALVDATGQTVPSGSLASAVPYTLKYDPNPANSVVQICAVRTLDLMRSGGDGGTGNLKGKINVGSGVALPIRFPRQRPRRVAQGR